MWIVLQWNLKYEMGLTINCFTQSNTKAILQLQIPRDQFEDEIIWDMNKNGVFSVRSAYFFY